MIGLELTSYRVSPAAAGLGLEAGDIGLPRPATTSGRGAPFDPAFKLLFIAFCGSCFKGEFQDSVVRMSCLESVQIW